MSFWNIVSLYFFPISAKYSSPLIFCLHFCLNFWLYFSLYFLYIFAKYSSPFIFCTQQGFLALEILPHSLSFSPVAAHTNPFDFFNLTMSSWKGANHTKPIWLFQLDNVNGPHVEVGSRVLDNPKSFQCACNTSVRNSISVHQHFKFWQFLSR